MEVSEVVEVLKAQFAGQLVLYVDDIAKVLGKSPKAISNLIARKGLPFKVKAVGGQRCVDVFQVAQWLASDTEVAQETVGEPIAPPAPDRRTKRPLGQGRNKLSRPVSGIAGEHAVGGMEQQILNMRHDFAAPMARFVQGLHDPQDFAFMQDVLERVCFSADALAESFVVHLSTLALIGSMRRGEESKAYFAAEPQASAYLLARLRNLVTSRKKTPNAYVVHLKLTRSAETLFHAVCAGGEVTVQTNLIAYELVGL